MAARRSIVGAVMSVLVVAGAACSSPPAPPVGTAPPDPSAVVAIDASYERVCAARSDGTGSCWGGGAVRPVAVAGLADAVDVSPGLDHTCALTRSAAVSCWGTNFRGAVAAPQFISFVSTPRPVEGLDQVAVLEVGVRHSCAVRTDHSVWCWGYNASGQLGTGNTVDAYAPVQVPGLAATDIAVEGSTSCALTTTSTVSCWGQLVGPSPVTLAGSDGAVELSFRSRPCIRLGDGAVRCGALTTGSVADVSSLAGSAQLGVSSTHTCVIRPDETVWCRGDNTYGQLGRGSLAVDGTVAAQVPGLLGVVQVDGAEGYTCALRREGTAWCWGSGELGQLGDGTTSMRLTPGAVAF